MSNKYAMFSDTSLSDSAISDTTYGLSSDYYTDNDSILSKTSQSQSITSKCDSNDANFLNDDTPTEDNSQLRRTPYSDNTVDVNYDLQNPDCDYADMCKSYQYTPAILAAVKRIIAMGDIHGDYQLAIKMFKLANLIDDNLNWIGKDTYVVQVGDQIDSCRPTFTSQCMHKNTTQNDIANDITILKLFNKLDKQAIEQGGRVISLLGNHEIMNAEGQHYYVSYENIKEFDNYTDPKTGQYIKEGDVARKHAFAPGNEHAVMLGCSRVASVIIGNNIFVHAGILPALLEDLNIKDKKHLENVNYLIRRWLLGKINKKYVDKIISSEKISMFWTRILGNIPPNVNNDDEKCVEYLDPVLETLGVGSIIIGHTPQSFVHSDTINGTCKLSKGDGGIWRVDNGSSVAFDNFDTNYKNTGSRSDSRKPQVLEILDDTKFNVLM